MLLSDDALESDARVYNEARTLLRNGYDVTVVVWNRKGTSEGRKEYEGIKIERIPLKVPFLGSRRSLFFYILLFNLKTFSKLLSTSFDAMHCHDLDTLLAGFLAGKIKGKKVIYDAHEIYPLMVQPYLPRIIVRMISIVEFLLARKVDALIVVSEIIADYFIKGVRGKVKISVIMNCKNPNDFITSRKVITELKVRFGIENHFIVLYDGWLAQDNGLEELFSAFEKLNGQIGDIMAVICGNGYAEKEFKRMVKEKNIENYVKFIGKIQSKDVPLFVNACDVMYIMRKPATKYNFLSTPNRLFEAIISGKPVIASNFGNIRRIVEKGGFGLLVNPEDINELCAAILTLRHDKKLGKRLGEKAKYLSKTHNSPLMEKRLLSLYESLIMQT